MSKYICNICGYVYDEEKGDSSHDIKPNTKWDALKDFHCPVCGVVKTNFTKQ